MKIYECAFEIAGPTAMFTRPDTGAAPISYPAPTYSAAKGMFESIVRLKSVYIRPTKVEICAPIKYERYTTNYGGPLRKSDLLSTRSSYQLKATVLVDVCYRLHGVVERFEQSAKGVNDQHAYQEIFYRRLERGQFFYVPSLGWKEFVPSYVGMFRTATRPELSMNVIIPSMLHCVFSQPVNGKVSPRYFQNVEIKEGVLKYAE